MFIKRCINTPDTKTEGCSISYTGYIAITQDNSIIIYNTNRKKDVPYVLYLKNDEQDEIYVKMIIFVDDTLYYLYSLSNLDNNEKYYIMKCNMNNIKKVYLVYDSIDWIEYFNIFANGNIIIFHNGNHFTIYNKYKEYIYDDYIDGYSDEFYKEDIKIIDDMLHIICKGNLCSIDNQGYINYIDTEVEAFCETKNDLLLLRRKEKRLYLKYVYSQLEIDITDIYTSTIYRYTSADFWYNCSSFDLYYLDKYIFISGNRKNILILDNDHKLIDIPFLCKRDYPMSMKLVKNNILSLHRFKIRILHIDRNTLIIKSYKDITFRFN